jgi:hypothetical protein
MSLAKVGPVLEEFTPNSPWICPAYTCAWAEQLGSRVISFAILTYHSESRAFIIDSLSRPSMIALLGIEVTSIGYYDI